MGSSGGFMYQYLMILFVILWSTLVFFGFYYAIRGLVLGVMLVIGILAEIEFGIVFIFIVLISIGIFSVFFLMLMLMMTPFVIGSKMFKSKAKTLNSKVYAVIDYIIPPAFVLFLDMNMAQGNMSIIMVEMMMIPSWVTILLTMLVYYLMMRFYDMLWRKYGHKKGAKGTRRH